MKQGQTPNTRVGDPGYVERLKEVRVYAVLDIKAGEVVHAVAGQRDRYRPVQSELVDSSRPYDVARAFVERRDVCDAYVADLDAIAGQSPDTESIEAIGRAGMRLVLDAGIQTAANAARLLEQLAPTVKLSGLVVPLESTRD